MFEGAQNSTATQTTEGTSGTATVLDDRMRVRPDGSTARDSRHQLGDRKTGTANQKDPEQQKKDGRKEEWKKDV